MRRTCGISILAMVFISTNAAAWGPHTEITRAAIAVLPSHTELKDTFGDELDRIARDYCWMGDWRESVRPDHYPDDYLLFPHAPEHFSHMLPAVRRSFEPFFRRALQAARTENPQNAARWIGSLLHFLQDSGSPPHAASVGGPTHSKMERWLDEAKIDIRDYKPRLLGENDEEATKGLLERMDQLHSYAKLRGDKLKPLVEKLTSRENQPLELECALETARVTADVLHTLFSLGRKAPAQASSALTGKIAYVPPAGYAKVPAKVVLLGTAYSTTTDTLGNFSFRNLPPGQYDACVLATGFEAKTSKNIELKPGKTTRLELELKPDHVKGNLVRNPSFALRWVRKDQPDCWYADRSRRDCWASSLIRVPVGQQSTLDVKYHSDKRAPISIRWRTDPSKAEGREFKIESLPATIAPDKLAKPFEKGFLFLELLIETKEPIEKICEHVSVVLSR